jgi:hypothetical protein
MCTVADPALTRWAPCIGDWLYRAPDWQFPRYFA